MWVSVGSSWLSALSPEACSEGSCHRAEPRHPCVEVESARPVRTTRGQPLSLSPAARPATCSVGPRRQGCPGGGTPREALTVGGPWGRLPGWGAPGEGQHTHLHPRSPLAAQAGQDEGLRWLADASREAASAPDQQPLPHQGALLVPRGGELVPQSVSPLSAPLPLFVPLTPSARLVSLRRKSTKAHS